MPYSTCSNDQNNTLTPEVLQEAIDKMKDLPKIPTFIFSKICPEDQMFKGPLINEIAFKNKDDLKFKTTEAIIINSKWKEQIEKNLKEYYHD